MKHASAEGDASERSETLRSMVRQALAVTRRSSFRAVRCAASHSLDRMLFAAFRSDEGTVMAWRLHSLISMIGTLP